MKNNLFPPPHHHHDVNSTEIFDYLISQRNFSLQSKVNPDINIKHNRQVCQRVEFSVTKSDYFGDKLILQTGSKRKGTISISRNISKRTDGIHTQSDR